MKILLLHCDYIKFKPLKKALRKIEDLKDKSEKKVDECLVVLTAVEKHDTDVKKVVEKFVENVKDIASQVNAKNIVLYPYAHLSSNLSSPEIAIKVLEGAEKELKKSFTPKGVHQGGASSSSSPSVNGDINTEGKVVRAPFGYYKEFELKVKGHPLSELSREIYVGGEGTPQAYTLKGHENLSRGPETFPTEMSTGGKESYDYKQLLREISKSKLDTSKLKPNDHRIIGQQMDLFSFSETAPGMVFWHNNGLIIRNELINFWRKIHRENGYQEVKTPQILDKKLWQISGHWEKYKENIFLTDYDKRTFAVKPMNCPGGMLIYKNRPKSYRDLPLKVGELGEVHRQELSGVLGGLFRVIQFTQDDAHIFCTEKQINKEVMNIVKLINFFYKKFKLNCHLEFSTRPEKRIGTDAEWDRAEKLLEDVLRKNKLKYKLNKGDGVFYGPKIDFHLKDSLGRTWQTATIQLDLLLPERFDINYTAENNKKKRPIILHRTVLGSLERFIGILLEHYSGRLPTWLAPIQVRVLSFTDRNEKYAKEIIKQLGEKIPNLRIDSDFRQTTIPAKVKDAELMRVPYIIVVGDREEKEKTIAVRVRGNKKIQNFGVEEFGEKIRKEIEERR